MFTVSDPADGDVELEVHFDEKGLAFLTDILCQAQSTGHEHVFEGSHFPDGLTIEEDEQSPIKMVTFYFESNGA
jgi:hypothetical protein